MPYQFISNYVTRNDLAMGVWKMSHAVHEKRPGERQSNPPEPAYFKTRNFLYGANCAAKTSSIHKYLPMHYLNEKSG